MLHLMKIRTYDELTAVADPAWPVLQQLITTATVAVSVLPPRDLEAGQRTLYRLQVTARSFLGALAVHCGAIMVDHGWLRLLGSGLDGLPSLAEANGMDEPMEQSIPPGHLVVAYDVLGGTFAVNGGGLLGKPGEVCYLGPDTLEWTPTGLPGHSAFVQWALSGGLAAMSAHLRWTGWEQQADVAAPGEGIMTYPPLWAAEARDGSPVSRSIVPLAELMAWHDESARQLSSLPDGQTVRVKVTDD
jgi:hypothetical protein